MRRACFFDCRSLVLIITFLTLSLAGQFSTLNPALAESESTPSATFTDCPSTSLVYPYVEYLYDKGMVDGYGDGTIRPDDTITRAEAAALLCRALSPITYVPTQPTYADVSPQYWAYTYIESAAHNGLFEGNGDGTFQPEALLTRAQLAALMTRIHKEAYPTAIHSIAFDDVSPDNWAYPVLAQAVDAGIMKTTQPNTIKPDSPGIRSDAFRGLAIATILDTDRSRVPLNGQIIPLQGDTYITKDGNRQIISGSVTCSVGDMIKTDADASAEIVFPDGSAFKLTGNTILTFTTAQGQLYIKEDGTPGVLVDELRIKLDQGQIFGLLSYSYFTGQNIPSAAMAIDSMPSAIRGFQDADGNEIPWWKAAFMQKERLTVDMPWSVAGVRGTIFSALVNAHQNSVTVVDGSVWFTGNGMTVQLTNPLNYSVVTARGESPSLPQAMPESWRQMWRENLSWLRNALERIAQHAPYPDSAPVFECLRYIPGSTPDSEPPIRQVIQNTIAGVEKELGHPPSSSAAGSSSGSSRPNAPVITGVTASDLGLNVGINNGDTITIDFDVDTNQPPVATKAEIDNLLDFGGQVLGADYTGVWVDPSTLVITVVDAAGATFATGDSVSIQSSGNLRTANGRSLASTSSQGCEGSFGMVVVIADSQLLGSLRDALSKPVGDITDTDLAGLTALDAFDVNIQDLSGLEYAVNLQTAILWGNLIDDVSPLAGLVNLQTLDLSWNQILDITPLSSLSNLVTLNLSNNPAYNTGLKEIGSLSFLSNLESLDLSNNAIEDVAPLSGLENLQDLNLSYNWLLDISPLLANPGLGTGDVLDLTYNGLDIRAGSEMRDNIQSLIDRGVSTAYDPQDLPVPDPIAIMSITASDSGSNAGLGNGDSITLVFDAYTNTPDVSTKANVDTLITFGTKSLGSDYAGVWSDAKTLVLTVIDASGADLQPGDTIQIQTAGNLRTADNMSDPSDSSEILTGLF